MRILRQPPLGIVDADRAQQVGAARGDIAPARIVQRLRDEVAHAPQRVERHQRVLQHVADPAAAYRAPVALAMAARIDAGDLEPVGVDHRVRAVQPDETARGDRLAGARFADERDAFAGMHGEVERADDGLCSSRAAKPDRQALDAGQRRGG